MESRLMLLLAQVERDCLELEKNGELTDYGHGQLDLIKMIREVMEW